MSSTASISIKFLADLKEFSTQMQNANRDIQKMGKRLKKVGKDLSVGVTAPFVAFSAVSLKNWDKQVKAIAQIDAGLKSTGDAVGFTSKQLQNMASDLQEVSLFGDEEIMEGVTSQLITFTNIAGQQFSRTQKAALDLASRLKIDLKSAAIQLGKALNDPVANLSALSRSGIQFSQAQKALVKSLVQTNRLSEAQNVILDELEKQYGGSAEAATKVGLGPMKQLSNSLGDLTEEFGRLIGEALLPLVERLKGLVKRFQEMDLKTKKLILVVGGLASTVGPLLGMLGWMMTSIIPGLIKAFGVLKVALTLLKVEFVKLTAVIAANPFGALAVAIGIAISAILLFNRGSKEVIKTQSLLEEINSSAARSIAKEKAKLKELLFVARNENIIKRARVKAIKELNKLSPKYLGNLTLEKINTDAARDAIKKYNAELLKLAKIKAAQKKLEEIQSKIIDVELAQEKASIKQAEKLASMRAEDIESMKRKQLLQKAIKEGVDGVSIRYGFQIKQLKEQENFLLKIIGVNGRNKKIVSNTVKERKKLKALELKSKDLDGVVRVNKVWEAQVEIFKQLRSAYVEGSKEYEKFTNLIKAANAQITSNQSGFELSKPPNVVDPFAEAQKARLQEFIQEVNSLMNDLAISLASGFGEALGGLFSGQTTLKQALGGMLAILADAMIQLGKLSIQMGIAITGIKKALKSLNPALAIAGGIALVALGTLIKGQVQSIGQDAGAFTNGGIVGGSSFSGDRLFARVNSGEMILNKRQQNNLSGMIQSPGGDISLKLDGAFRVTGEQLDLVLSRHLKSKNRKG